MTQPDDLVYYPDDRPGIRRRRAGRGFAYYAPDGTRIDDRRERRRIKALAVPPAYEDVWICPQPNGHLQATGRDTRKRKQYRYHPDWRAWRDATKFDGLAEFGRALPTLRRRIRADLAGEAGERDTAIAAVLALIDRLSLRVGHADTARENGTYGATTLRNSHVTLEEGSIRLRYPGKGGGIVDKRLKDARLMKLLGRLHDLPGASFVSWVGPDGASHEVSSHAVNARISEITGESGFTAKTFRTWAGSEAALSVALQPQPTTIRAMTEAAAARLHNTPAISRSSYVHPRVIALSEATDAERLALMEDLPARAELRQAERALLRLLDQ
ncbi:DNA topoisomerase IB [Histidinibacterium aquaticum]|uniref:DNA topoisomerase n=1 Tax=Histidinibacterium aquaticum TaxID=2613962 RepID=A0A5J5GF89_9RHOB|nr:DNA topoisomerase IB [Histidinibacterium aquaticum]KAA9006670.1 DNA topoisomerase IB [Histidinibacterium aquaticum]